MFDGYRLQPRQMDHILDYFDRGWVRLNVPQWIRRTGTMDIRCEIVRRQPRALLNETHGVGPTCLNNSYQPHHPSFFFSFSSYPRSAPRPLSHPFLVPFLYCSVRPLSSSRFVRFLSTCLLS